MTHTPNVYRLILLIVVLLTVSSLAFGQTEVVELDPNEIILTRNLGDQTFSFSLGPFLPLFSYNPNSGESTPLIGSSTDPRLSLGAIAVLRWGAFLNPILNLGVDLSWGFNIGANGDLLSQFAPVSARLSTYLRSGVWEFPIHVALGMNLMSYKTSTIITPLVKTGFSALWNGSGDWAFGVNLMYWWIPELYGNNTGSPGPSNNRFGNFLEISLSALYNF